MTSRILAVSLIIGAIAIGIAGYAIKRPRQPATMWTIQSPHQVYRIDFAGLPAVPSWPFTKSHELKNRRITANVTKNGTALVQAALVYDGDAYDSSFTTLYPDHEWLSESTVHLWQKTGSQNPRAIPGEIILTNESRQNLKYAYIAAGKTNLFLLFEITPEDRITLPVQLQHWEEVIGCEGKIADRDLSYSSGNFSLSTAGKAGTRYRVRFDEHGCTVTRDE